MGVSSRKSRCMWPGCEQDGRSAKPSYCSRHYYHSLRVRWEDAAVARMPAPRWVRRARRAIMRELMHELGPDFRRLVRGDPEEAT